MNLFFFRTIRLGIKSLLLHKMRAGLAGLGIFIGTATVIWLVAMGEGVSHRAQEQIKELGAKNVIVRTKKPTSDNEPQMARVSVHRYGLLRADYKRITETLPSVKEAVPMRELEFSGYDTTINRRRIELLKAGAEPYLREPYGDTWLNSGTVGGL